MKISFHGGIRGVTGSCHLLEAGGKKILIDCGMYQGERMCGKKNFEEFGFDAHEIDAVIVTHAHYDHTGRLPLLIERGFTGTVYATPPTKSMMQLVLEDAYNVMRENAEKCGDDILYPIECLHDLTVRTQGIGYHTAFDLGGGLTAMFHDAGHILGSSYVSIDVPASEVTSGKPMRVVFSGDLGNDDVPILPDTEPIDHADVVVCESTYGDRDHEPHDARTTKLIEVADRVLGQGGTLIIPVFSIERTQELLYEIDKLVDEKRLPSIPVYLDSPLAIRVTGAYRDFASYLRFDRSILSSPDRDFFSFPRLNVTLSVDASKEINKHREPKIILAGSGMMTGGRVLHHLSHYLPDEKSGVLIVGYQAEHTLGRLIQDGAKEVTIFGKPITVRASVDKIEAFSAHADRNKIKKWLKPENGKIKTVFLVHGEPKVKESFKTFLKKEIKSDIVIPGYLEEFDY